MPCLRATISVCSRANGNARSPASARTEASALQVGRCQPIKLHALVIVGRPAGLMQTSSSKRPIANSQTANGQSNPSRPSEKPRATRSAGASERTQTSALSLAFSCLQSHHLGHLSRLMNPCRLQTQGALVAANQWLSRVLTLPSSCSSGVSIAAKTDEDEEDDRASEPARLVHFMLLLFIPSRAGGVRAVRLLVGRRNCVQPNRTEPK